MLDDHHLERGVADVVAREGPNARHQHSAEDIGDEYCRVELITGRCRRRDWTLEEKAKIVAAGLDPGRSVTEVAAQYQVSRGLLWTWRRNAREASAHPADPTFVPLRLAAAPPDAALAAQEPVSGGVVSAGAGLPSGSIEIAVGRARVRVQGVVDREALRQVLTLMATAR